MTKKFIFIPVVNNFFLLEKAINSVPTGLFDKYFIFNNSNGKIPIDIKHFEIFDIEGGDMYTRYTFLQTQNIMREYAIKHQYDYYSFMHNDGEIVDDSAERILLKADDLIQRNEKWSVIFTNYDVFCVYFTECVSVIGEWGDQDWPKDQHTGYFLDNDYYRRMRLANYPLFALENANVLHNSPSNTIILDNAEHNKWEDQKERVSNHYIRKWGGNIYNEKYTVPFNL
jgi:hypothetical protein